MEYRAKKTYSQRISMLLLACLFVVSPVVLKAQSLTIEDYGKQEVYIKMRDGVALYTAIYQPKNTTAKYPFLINRTPYGCWPYGDKMPNSLMYNDHLVEEGYIFVYQDIRGRSMSDGEDMINLTPVFSQSNSKKVDETTDTYDTMKWLLKNVKNNNGNAGLYGNSYKGWTALMGGLSGHPAVKAVQIGAPSVNGYFEDFTRYGLFTLAYTPIIDWFGTPKTERHEGPWWERKMDYYAVYNNYNNYLDKDSYSFFLEKGALKNYTSLLSESNYFYQYLKEHPNYDEARQERNTLQYIKNMNCPALVVGGWNDGQNMYGIVNTYEAVSKNNKATTKYIVGPWNHGDFRENDSAYYVGNIFYGTGFGETYKKQEFEFFQAHLKGKVEETIPTISFFDTGRKTWDHYEKMPVTTEQELFFSEKEQLIESAPVEEGMFFEYLSDPAKPVPYLEDDRYHLFVPKYFMTADQRFASKRPDVLTFATAPLEEDLTITGPLQAQLKFSTDHQDADLIVKLIDVLPMDRPAEATDQPEIKMNGYQQQVRVGYIRGRYRADFSNPKPFVPNEVTDVPVELLDIHHTFKKGHRIMIQVQSSLFPLFDRNPQNYVENIYNADDADFEKANHRIYLGSKLVFSELSRNE